MTKNTSPECRVRGEDFDSNDHMLLECREAHNVWQKCGHGIGGTMGGGVRGAPGVLLWHSQRNRWQPMLGNVTNTTYL